MEFIQEKRILVADTSAGVRAGIASVLRDLGAKSSNMVLAHNFDVAVTEIKRFKPHVLICDYHMDDRCGLELFDFLKGDDSRAKNSLTMLVSADSDQSALAEAADEDIDSFILKPFTLAKFKNEVIKIATEKITPSEYQSAILEGKELLKRLETVQALTQFMNAIEKFKKPTLAHYYVGHCLNLLERHDEAEKSFRAGLDLSENHYLCMYGLCELLKFKKRYAEAYTLAQQIVNIFPVSASKLECTVELAIHNEKYEEISKLFEIYESMNFKSPELMRYMESALMVCGIFFLRQWQIGHAMAFFRKVITVSNRQQITLDKMVAELQKSGYTQEADEILSEFQKRNS